MLKIQGTHHLMKKEEIESIIKNFNPDIIGVELCETRINTMVINPIEHEDNVSMLGKIVKGLNDKAKEEGLEYGSDMIYASKFALENNIKLVPLDLDVRVIQFMFQILPDNEKNGFLEELKEMENKEEKLSKELVNKVNEVDNYMNRFMEKYPITFMLSVKYRDLFIAFNIMKLTNENKDKKILVFLGKGHVKEVERLCK
jgi:pheromone shutdown protein TraB